MKRFADRIVNTIYRCYVVFHCVYYYFFHKGVRRKMKCILGLTESNSDVTADGQIERALPGFTRYYKTGYYKYMLGRYLYSVKYIEDKTVLECGCGLGWGSFLISDYAQELVSIDLDREALDFARATWKSDKLNFVEHSTLDLEGLNRKFDVILGFELIEHLHFSDGAKLLEQANRVLTEDGLIILSSGFPRSPQTARRQEATNKFHLHIYTKAEMRDLLAEKGFSMPRFLGSFMVIARTRRNNNS